MKFLRKSWKVLKWIVQHVEKFKFIVDNYDYLEHCIKVMKKTVDAHVEKQRFIENDS